jgi:Uma2 family endonuclease
MVTALRPRNLSKRPLTIEDFEAFPDDGNRYEIMGGQLFVTPAPALLHQWIIATLTSAFNAYLLPRRLGVAFPAPTDVQFGEHDIVEPDLVVVLQPNLGKLRDTRIIGAPDLVIEITSPSTASRDRVRKSALYAQEGVREYWIADPRAQSVIVQALQDGRWAAIQSEAGVAKSTILPDFFVVLQEVLNYPAWMNVEHGPRGNE